MDGGILSLDEAKTSRAGIIKCHSASHGIALQGSKAIKHSICKLDDKTIIVSEGHPEFFTDVFCVKDDSIRLYRCSDVDMSKLVYSLGGHGNDHAAIVPKMSLKRVKDYGLLYTIANNSHEIIGNNLLIEVDQIDDKWLMPGLISVLGRIFPQYKMIAFGTTVNCINHYDIIHNVEYEGYETKHSVNMSNVMHIETEIHLREILANH